LGVIAETREGYVFAVSAPAQEADAQVGRDFDRRRRFDELLADMAERGGPPDGRVTALGQRTRQSSRSIEAILGPGTDGNGFTDSDDPDFQLMIPCEGR